MRQLSPGLPRRAAIVAIAGAVSPLSVWCQQSKQELAKPYGWFEETIDGRKVYVRGRGNRTVVLLHEINGLSPGCVDFGDELAIAGFKVYMPLLFGHALQDSTILGGIESCFLGGFKCGAPGGKKNTKPVVWVDELVKHLSERNEVSTVAVIGMCESGAYPLATMHKDSKVKAVVLSQPALPFGRDKQRDVGLTEETMMMAKESDIPILAFRFKEDTISTCDRFEFLSKYFGTRQFDGHILDGPSGFHQTLTHRLHAVLTGPFGEVRECARRDVIRFLCDHLK
jgi:dienelactone hydrolase